MMIEEIKAWLERTGHVEGGTDDLRIAVAALLVEAAHIDDSFVSSERSAIGHLLERRFGLSAPAARQLLATAEEVADRSAQLFRFTRIINERLSPEQRVEVIEMMWEVAYADGDLDALEDTLLRRVGGLIYVPDRERGEARQRVLQRLGKSPDGASLAAGRAAPSPWRR
jgi:uncharacterized tellurite resistance protein B-like protein